MPFEWTFEKLKTKSPPEIQSLYRRANNLDDDAARKLVALILDNDLLKEAAGGLPHDHPHMLEIEEICGERESIDGALQAVDAGLPPLAGMEQRIVARMGDRYGPSGTTNHAGRCIAFEMEAKGLLNTHRQMSMPAGSIAQSATIFERKAR